MYHPGSGARTSLPLLLLLIAPLSWAAEPFELWDTRVPFPSVETMPFLSTVTHVSVERATPKGPYYLHESGIAYYKGQLHALWANGPTELNFYEESTRTRVSKDKGMTWSASTEIAPGGPQFAHNHPVIFTHKGQLWAYATNFNKGEKRPRVKAFLFNAKSGKWEARGQVMEDFVPFDPPKKMADGNWILTGEKSFDTNPRVLISNGDDFSHWTPVDLPMPDGMKLIFPETTTLVYPDELIAVTRNSLAPRALVSVSRDNGRRWSTLEVSNLPMVASKPLGGVLSTGQRYLISNTPDKGRQLLTIAVTAPGERKFSKVWKIRHQGYPLRRSTQYVPLEAKDGTTHWAYPAALELDGKLYVTYSVAKEDCELSIIPLTALRVD